MMHISVSEHWPPTGDAAANAAQAPLPFRKHSPMEDWRLLGGAGRSGTAAPLAILSMSRWHIVRRSPYRRGRLAERQAQRGNGTAWRAGDWKAGRMIDTSGSGRETTTAREILGAVDADILRAARRHVMFWLDKALGGISGRGTKSWSAVVRRR